MLAACTGRKEVSSRHSAADVVSCKQRWACADRPAVCSHMCRLCSSLRPHTLQPALLAAHVLLVCCRLCVCCVTVPRAVVLEMIGDLPEAEVKPPSNMLFVCKLNPVTTEEDLDIIFSRCICKHSYGVVCQIF